MDQTTETSTSEYQPLNMNFPNESEPLFHFGDVLSPREEPFEETLSIPPVQFRDSSRHSINRGLYTSGEFDFLNVSANSITGNTSQRFQTNDSMELNRNSGRYDSLYILRLLNDDQEESTGNLSFQCPSLIQDGEQNSPYI